MGSNSMVQINGFWFLTAQDCLKISLAYLLQQQQVPSSFHRTEMRSEEHTSELQSQSNLVCRLLLEKKKANFVLATRAWNHAGRTIDAKRVSPGWYQNGLVWLEYVSGRTLGEEPRTALIIAHCG